MVAAVSKSVWEYSRLISRIFRDVHLKVIGTAAKSEAI